MDQDHDAHDHIFAKSTLASASVLSGLYMALALTHPVIWAWLTAIIVAMLFGLFTAKFILGVQYFWKALALAPLLGCCWIGLFFLIIRVATR
jgi:hypothetical protein